MKTASTRALLALVFASTLAGCHARWFPLGSAPTYKFRTQSVDGTLNKKTGVTLSDDDEFYAGGIRYEVPAAGALIITAKPVNPAVQVTLNVYAEGGGNTPIARSEPGKKLEAQDLAPGTYFVVAEEPWKEAVKTRVDVTTLFKPADPDGANGPYKSQAGARELSPDHGAVSDSVDYSSMRRTNFWKIPLPGEGGLNIKFTPAEGANLTAEFIPAQGAPEKIDPTVGLKKDDLPPGDYFVKVTANDAGDSGKYDLTTTFKQGDTCKNGGPACSLEGAEELKVPQDSKTADVDYTKGKQFHFYKLSAKEKGKLTIAFKVLQPQRGSKVQAFYMKAPDDDGDRITGSSVTKTVDPGEVFIKVMAPDAGDTAKYAVQTIFQPDNFISGEVLEIDRSGGRGGCMLTVGAGTNQNVRAGAACTIVAGTGGNAVDSCVVDQVFPNLSKVRAMNPSCKIPNSGAKVQINAQ